MNSCGHNFIIWQIIDSAFPTGGFVHSSGLEATWQQGEIRGSRQFEEYIEASLTQMANTVLPFVGAAHDTPENFQELDFLCDSYLINHVSNRASRQQGRAFLSTTRRIFPQPKLEHIAAQSLVAKSPQHWPAMFGVVAEALRVARIDALSIFTFFQLRTLISSGIRLGIVGPFEGGGIQGRLSPFAERLVREAEFRGMETIAQTAPLLDLWQGNQDRLYSRLFQS